MQRGRRLLILAGFIGLALAALPPLATNIAYARTCYGTYCIYEAQGCSGTGARGTAVTITLPYGESLPHSDDILATAAFLIANPNTAIETGLGYGYSVKCGTLLRWSPYATLNNGQNEMDDRTYTVNDGSIYQVQSFVRNGTGFSFFNSQYGTPIWAINWGTYNITGSNETQVEVHGDNDQPSFNGVITLNSEQWYNGSSWSSWGYTNVFNDCPYDGFWQSNNSWYARDVFRC